MKLLNFKKVLLGIIAYFFCHFIDQYTQLVPGIFDAPHVFGMETVGVFDLLAGHVR